MQKLHYEITINAPRQKVWDAMLTHDSYLEWTEVFNPDPGAGSSSYEGSWETGSDIRFLGDNPDGTKSGMFARIKENRSPEFLSIQHLGEVHNNVDQPWEDGGEYFENYTLNEVDENSTQVLIDIDVKEEYADMFNGMWPKALEKLKEIAERQ